MYLAAAGVGRLVLAHGGKTRLDDLQRQVYASTAGVGRLRVEQAAERYRAINPNVRIEEVAENVTEENAARLVGSVDLVVSCSPLFTERFPMNREAVRQGKPGVDCAMYDMEMRVTTILPGKTPCLACLYPEKPPGWKREFPVLGAVSCTAGGIGALEAIKVLSGVGEPLAGRMLVADLRAMNFRVLKVSRDPACRVCGSA
jgi:molybdopterin/thiamine biosynthesis adenylyltransferase